MAVRFGSVWVAGDTAQAVFRFVPRTAQPRRRCPVTGHISADGLAVGEDTL